jgi:hypothetical protein
VFAKLPSMTFSFFMSDCMHGKHGASTGLISLKSEENDRYFT